MRSVEDRLAEVVAAERLRVVAGLVRLTKDLDLAEDCTQDAVERALRRWPGDGVPDNPAAWLTTAARRRALDVLKRRRLEQDKVRELGGIIVAHGSPGEGSTMDDRLQLLFMCCHPALPLAGRVALTLKTVTGLSTREVARAFMVTEATMSRRLLRTRTKIIHAGISFRMPEPHRLAERTSGVLAVVYLLFNEGYAATSGPALRADLATEAVRLAGLMATLLPDDDEAAALHALLLFQHSRRETRVGDDGELRTMEEQDRTRWDRPAIASGLVELDRARHPERPAGPYRIQAEIAALHAQAPTPADTQWDAIVRWYDRLLDEPNPVVSLNRAVAVGYRDGPEAGLAALDTIDLPGYHLLEAVRADLLHRVGRSREAAAAYRRALETVGTDAERRLLSRRLAEIEG